MNGPMYLRIAQEVRDRIATGTYRPGLALPSERDLMEQFAVSRVTIRRALKELVREALIESRQGSGYIVRTALPLDQPLNHVTSFSEDCMARGLIPGSRLISRKIGRCKARESAHFGIAEGAEVLRVKRIRTGNGEPLLVEYATLLRRSRRNGPGRRAVSIAPWKRTAFCRSAFISNMRRSLPTRRSPNVSALTRALR